MAYTLDEFVNRYSAVQHLKKNLEANIDVYCDGWTREEKAQLLRANLIMVRACLLDFGADNGMEENAGTM